MTHLYVHSSMVSRKVDTKWNVVESPVGQRSGNSGKQKQIQECTSAWLNVPDSFSALYCLQVIESEAHFYNMQLVIREKRGLSL